MEEPRSNTTNPVYPDDDATHYDQFFGPLYFEPFAIEVAKRIDPACVGVALEIAAGTGRVTSHIRGRLLPSAKLIASDINSNMLAVAKNKLGHLEIDWQIIDAQQLPFSDNSIDLVVCCFGYMFVPDKVKAFAETCRVLRPGGHFLFTTWDKLENNPASYISTCMARQYLDEPLPPSYDQPTAMCDEHMIRLLLQDAEFSKTSVEKVALRSSVPVAKEAARGFMQGSSVYAEIKKRSPEKMAGIQTRLEEEFVRRFGDKPMVVPISALIGEAWK